MKIDRAPDMVDNFGTKWWRDNSATDYAVRNGVAGEVWFIEELNGLRKFVFVMYNTVQFESEFLEAVGQFIDKLRKVHAKYKH